MVDSAAVQTPAPAPPPSPPTAETRERIDRLIIVALDPGHGGEDLGSPGPHGLWEGKLTLDLSRRVKAWLAQIAPALRVAGHAPDGLVEAVELPNHPFGLAVQWHPEWLTDQESTKNLFRKFVEAAG